MRLIIILFFLFINPVSAQVIYVTRIVDGDTFKDSTDLSYRLIGINTPESKEVGGQEATAYLERLINNKYVLIVTDNKYDTIDFYKRKLCYVYLNGRDVNKLMIQMGYASVYTKYPFGKIKEYLILQKEFISNKHRIKKSTSVNNSNFETILIFKNMKNTFLLILIVVLIVIAFYYYRK